MSIICDRGGTRIKGTTIETIQDFVNIINAVRVSLEDEMDPEDAAGIMEQCGRLAYATGDKNTEAEAAAFREITDLLLKNGKM